MKRIINYRSVVVILSLALTISCSDFLDREPLGRYTSDTYPAGGLSEYVYGMYADLRSYGVHAFPFVGITSITSDDADKGSTPADAPSQKDLDDFTILPNNPLVTDFYRSHYSAISKCNLVIKVADSLESKVSEEEFILANAEARFIRAYLYFNLVRTFGGVPLVDKVLTNQGTFNIARSTKEDIYFFIEEDLMFAQEHLPLSWPDFTGRSTKGAAQGLLAKVYLYQQKWGQSLQMSQNVIALGQYDLDTPYESIFTEAGENSNESIFEIQNIRNASYNFGSQYGEVQGVRGSGAWNLGWGFNTPSQRLVDAYETGDPRREATILFKGEITPYGEIVPNNLPNDRYNQKVYTNPTFRAEANAQNSTWVNIRLLRYADIVLMAAEAANEIDQSSVALENLEMIRARARGLNASVLPEITTSDKELLRNYIRHERRIELAMEHERFFDLVRWGIAADVLHAAGKANFSEGTHELMPIPQEEIDLSAGILSQNPGY